MLSNRLAFAGLAVACLGAAAGGGYFATRQSAVPAEAEAAGRTSAVSTSARTLDTAPAQERDVVSEPDGSAKPPSPAPAPPSRRSEPPSRPAPARAAKKGVVAAKRLEPLPAVDHSASVGTVTNSAPVSGNSAPPAPQAEATFTPRADDRASQEAPRPAEAPQKAFEELVVVADSVIGLQAETTVTSDHARVEDKVEARVTRDVRVHGAVAIPSGSRALGSVVSVERGGKFKERARLGIRFNTLVLADGTRMPISTETIYREGDAPGQESAAKMTGAAVGGAILGAILGGGKGAAIGGAVGAGAGSAAVMASDRSFATLRSGEPITVRIVSPVTVTIEQK